MKNLGESAAGNRYEHTTPPMLPKQMVMPMPTVRFVLPPMLLPAHIDEMGTVEYIPAAARKVPMYCAATSLEVIRRMKPTIAVEKKATRGAKRVLKRSEYQPPRQQI